MLVAGGSTNVTTYFAMRLTADGTAAINLTITDFDLQYVRSGVAPVAKVDATALAATDSAHGDNQAIQIDATDQPGLYRVDWPDAAFAAGVREVILSVKVATAFTEHLRVEIDGEVTAEALGTQAKADVNAEADTALTDSGIEADLDNGTDGLGALKTLIDTVNTDLSNGTDGLGALKALIDTVDDFLDTEIAAITAAVITNAAGADVAADIIAIKAETALIVADTDVIDDGTSGLLNLIQLMTFWIPRSPLLWLLLSPMPRVRISPLILLLSRQKQRLL